MREAPLPDEPLVTVVLPFLNEERHLLGAIGTVQAQTYTRWELLLVDDGSTDRSAADADAAAAADPDRVRVLRHPGRANRGLPASRNLGLLEARGAILAPLDADDRWEPAKLRRQVAVLTAHPEAGMVCGATWYAAVDGSRPPELVPVLAGGGRVMGRGVFARRLVTGAVTSPPPSNVAFLASVLRACGGVPLGDNLYEDQRTFVAVSLRSAVVVGDEALSWYALRPDSLYGSLSADGATQTRQRRDFERWLVVHARSAGLQGRRLQARLALHRLARGSRRRAELALQRSLGGRGR